MSHRPPQVTQIRGVTYVIIICINGAQGMFKENGVSKEGLA